MLHGPSVKTRLAVYLNFKCRWISSIPVLTMSLYLSSPPIWLPIVPSGSLTLPNLKLDLSCSIGQPQTCVLSLDDLAPSPNYWIERGRHKDWCACVCACVRVCDCSVSRHSSPSHPEKGKLSSTRSPGAEKARMKTALPSYACFLSPWEPTSTCPSILLAPVSSCVWS